jgi:hypothetical protein
MLPILLGLMFQHVQDLEEHLFLLMVSVSQHYTVPVSAGICGGGFALPRIA